MRKLNIAAGDWVVVCDGSKALVCRNAGDEAFLDLKVIEDREMEDLPTRDLGAQRPGRVQEAVSTERSAVGQTDWHDEAERAFLKELAERLHHAAAAGEVSGLFLVAPPRALGMIRPVLSPAVVRILRGELDKDYVKLPIGDIEKRLTE
jgi:protein required for attachment to host cells